MSTLSGFPYQEVQFTKEGRVHDDGEVAALLATIDQAGLTDLIVVAHGWNNDMPAARALYQELCASMRALLDAGGPELATRRLGVLGVLWPSRKFAERAVIASGAATLGAETADEAVEAGLDNLAAALDEPHAAAMLAAAKRLIGRLEDDPIARRALVDAVRGALPADAADDEDASAAFFRLPGERVIERLRRPLPLVVRPSTPADAGGAAGIGELVRPAGGPASLGGLLADAKAAALRVINYSTYYLMKERAGVVGRTGVRAVLRRVRAQRRDLRLHLVGHSFGGRVVTAAAAAAAEPPPVRLSTLTLLQAAFSHHGFARDFDGTRDGFFRRVIDNGVVAGPILITHTVNDRAVGQMYPLASLLAGDDAAALGDANDRFGGIGRNGAQKTPEAVAGRLLGAGEPYQFASGRLHNLEASAFVGDHGDVTGREVASAILAAIATT